MPDQDPTDDKTPTTNPESGQMNDSQTGGAGDWKQVAPYAMLSLVMLLLGCAIVYFLVEKADKIVAFGLVGNLFYVALIPLGLAAAVFLFAVLRSYATWSGKVLGGLLNIGGPIVAFLLVVILGFVLIAPPIPFSVAVYVHGDTGKQDRPLRGDGEVVMRLGQDPRTGKIDSDGRALFVEIPPTFMGKLVDVWVEHKDYETVGDSKYELANDPIDLVVRRKSALIAGTVMLKGGRPGAGAELIVGKIKTMVSNDGRFSIEVPSDQMADAIRASVTIDGYQPWIGVFIPGSNDPYIILTPLE